MTLLDNVLRARNSIESPLVPISSDSIVDFIGGDLTSHAGVSVSETSSLGIPPVWRATTLVAGTCASMPLHAYAKEGDSREPLTSGAVVDILEKPHPDIPPYEFWEMVYAHRALWGNAYLLKLRDGSGTLKELWPIHPARVKAGRGSIGKPNEIGQKVYLIDGKEPHTDDTILHLPGFGYDGICGVSVVRVLRQGIALGIAAEEYGARLFGNGTLATGVLQTEQRLDQEQADTILKRWRSKRAGLDKSHDIIVLDSGAEFKQLTIPPDDAQFLQTREFQITEIGRIFGVPPFLMYATEKSTSWGTGLEQQAIGWVKFDLRRWYMPVEQRLTAALGTGKQYVRYSVDGLLRGDSAARATWYQQMWQLGAFSTNEIRALEELDPVEGGDARYRPLNMGELGEFESGDTANDPTTPFAPPPPPPPPAPAPTPEEDPNETKRKRAAHSG